MPLAFFKRRFKPDPDGSDGRFSLRAESWRAHASPEQASSMLYQQVRIQSFEHPVC